MASGYTTNYSLCQWQPEDSFLREEFNQDNARIDAAIAAVGAAAGQALAGLEPVNLNLYSLILRDYYEGKDTGWKKALLFDGFLDGSRVEDLTGGLTLGDRRLTLQGEGMGNVDLNFSGGMGGSTETTRTVTATSSATLKGFGMELYSDATYAIDVMIDYILTVNNEMAERGTYFINGMSGKSTVRRNVMFSREENLKKGDTFSLKLSANGSALHFTLSSGGGLGGTFYIGSNSGTEGQLTSVAEGLPAATRVFGWVRHSGGTVALSLMDSGGVESPLTFTGDRDSISLQGETCRESAFQLTKNLNAGTWSVLLDVTLGEDTEAHIFDYGIAWL